MNKTSKKALSKYPLKGYEKFLHEIKIEIEKRRHRALQTVNRELISLYWGIGKKIVEKQEQSGWGENIVEKLAQDLSTAFPDTKGFSKDSIWRMRKFYLFYRNHKKLAPLVQELSWSNNLIILENIENLLEIEFYLKIAIKERWSKRQLQRQIDTDLFTRYINVKDSNKTLPAKSKDTLAPFKDLYVLDFLGLEENHSEKELRKAILGNLRDFFLEFGKNITFVGEEYPLRVGTDTFSIDLLFYHRELKCLIPVELKIGKFKPEYVGKMQFYLAALDEQIKLKSENPSIGLILCKSKNNETVRIAFSQAVRKIGIAAYQTKILDTKLLTKKLHHLELPETFEEKENG